MSDQDREVVITIKAKNLTDAEAKGAAASVLNLNTQIEGASGSAQRGTQSFKSFVTDGMGKAGLAATDSGKLIAGMSQSGMAPLAKTTENATTAGEGLSSMLGHMNGLLATFGVGLSVGALVSFGQGLIDMGSHIDDLSKESGLSTDFLQALGAKGRDVGLDMDTLAMSASQLALRLAAGDGSVAAAAAYLGLSFDKLRELSIDDMLKTVLGALIRVESASQQAALANELFGRSGVKLLGIIRDNQGGLDGLVESAKAAGLVLGKDDVQALDKAGDAWANLGTSIKVTTGSWLAWIYAHSQGGADQSLIDAARGYSDAVHQTAKDIDLATAASTAHISASQGLENQLKALRENALVPLSAAQRKHIDELTEWGKSEGDIAKLVEAPIEAVHRYTDAHKKATDAAKQWKAVTDELNTAGADWRQTIDEINGDTVEAIKFYLAAGVSQGTLAKAYGVTAVQVKAVSTALAEQNAHLYKAQRLVGSVAGSFVDDFTPVIAMVNAGFGATATELGHVQLATYQWEQKQIAVNNALRDGEQQSRSLNDAVKTSLKDMPQLLQQAFTGGGGVGGALNAVGAKIGADLFSKGGALEKAGQAATTDLKGMFGETIGGALGAAIPGIGALIGPGLKLLWSGIKKLFGGPGQEELEGRSLSAAFQAQIASMLTSQQKLEAGGQAWKMTAIGIRDLYLSMGKTAADAERVTAALFDTKNPAAYKGAIKEVQDQLDLQTAQLNQQKEAHQALDDAVQKYGFTVDELGPKFRNQKLHEMAEELFGDYGLLTGSGIDVVNVNTRMADKVNDYIKTVRKAGTEVPAEMRPMLESLAEQGLLTDANGNKITDLKDSGITFATTLTEGFAGIVDKLDELLIGLGIKLPEAIDKIPTTVDIDINERHHRTIDGENVPDVPGHARGGVFSRPHLARIAEGGEPEIVGSQRFMAAALRQAMASGGSSLSTAATPQIYVTVNAQGAFLDTPASMMRLGDRVAEALVGNLALTKRLNR